MPRTAEHLVETHHIASARRASGQPIWAHRIDVSDVFHNETMTFEQIRDAVVARIRSTAWFTSSETVQNIIEELADSVDRDEFDGPWDALYDEADYDRVWIKTR